MRLKLGEVVFIGQVDAFHIFHSALKVYCPLGKFVEGGLSTSSFSFREKIFLRIKLPNSLETNGTPVSVGKI